METLNFFQTAPLVGEYDVVVCGGGPAGFIAAIAAARQGARTALIERFGFLGGMATAGLVSPISVFSYNGRQVIGGIPWEFVRHLEAMGGALVEQPLNNVAFDPELYRLCAQRMVLEAGVECFTNSYLVGCHREGDSIRYAFFANKNGIEAVSGRVFVDATGDADLAHLAGVPMQPKSDAPLQPLSTYFCLEGVDTDSELLQCMHHNRQGVNCHCVPVREKMIQLQEVLSLPKFGGPWFCTLLRPGCVTVNVTRASADACDNRQYGKAEAQLREDVFTLAKVLRDNFPEFRNSRVSHVATQAGIRETRRILGHHTVTAQEYLSAYQYPDSVSRGCHPIDIHSNEINAQSVRFLEKAAYVPYRALVSVGARNLLAAGRCLSADREAFASLRVQASAMGAGQAAGVAAAMAAKDGLAAADVDTDALRETLRGLGAIL